MPTPIESLFFDLKDNQIVFQQTITGTKKQTLAGDLDKIMTQYSSGGFFDSGLLPIGARDGVLMVRGGFGHLQIVYQVEPGLYHNIWGAHEGSANAKTYNLAQPWRIWIADFYDGSILGARHFYSPVPITTGQEKLYHVNLPNTNCRGYNRTGVGWMCLYHGRDRIDTTKFNLQQYVQYAYRRASGEEAFNDGNMSGTDGPRYYASLGRPDYFTNPAKWQAKSNAEGYAWTLDDKLLAPVMVDSRDSQQSGHQGKHHLTADDAWNGTAQAYYQDKWPLKPIAALKRGELDKHYPNLMRDHFIKTVQAIAKPASIKVPDAPSADPTKALAALRGLDISLVPLVPHGPCPLCGTLVPDDEFESYDAILPENFEDFNTPDTTAKCCKNCKITALVAIPVHLYYEQGKQTDRAWIHSNLALHLGEDIGWVYNGAGTMISPCPHCATPWPRYIDKVYDYKVLGYVNGQVQVVGCIQCTGFVDCVVTNNHISTDHTIVVQLPDYTTNPPTNHDAVVASWVISGDNPQYKSCACNMLAHCTQLSENTYNGEPVCNGCWNPVQGEFRSAFYMINTAVNEFITPVLDINLDEPVYFDDDDDDDDDDPLWDLADDDMVIEN